MILVKSTDQDVHICHQYLDQFDISLYYLANSCKLYHFFPSLTTRSWKKSLLKHSELKESSWHLPSSQSNCMISNLPMYSNLTTININKEGVRAQSEKRNDILNMIRFCGDNIMYALDVWTHFTCLWCLHKCDVCINLSCRFIFSKSHRFSHVWF